MNLLNQAVLTAAQEAYHEERLFAAQGYHGNATGHREIEIFGNAPLLLSSPHATAHPREGKIKQADSYTGTIAIQLAKLIDANALIYAHTTDEDPNYDMDGPYKQHLVSLIARRRPRLVLDLHGMKLERPVDFAFGTGGGVTIGKQTALLTTFVHTFEQSGFRNLVVDQSFASLRPTTITSFTWRTCHVPAIQLEINKRYRDPAHDLEAYASLLALLCNALNRIKLLL